ncbi:hypothetical protein [Vibrio atlanticus]|uniref:hypothetical protein n=1 Tax=Vibrio atlanticus TaxID=693153 RepID=UPI0022B071FA|nr:hypothetical protein [Vibrio atlanticus]MCZ4308362.1 hypothetical protein [Vibrio atlanticus]
MMNKSAVELCEEFLVNDRTYNVENDIWASVVEITNRLLARRAEMTVVYKELGENYEQSHINVFLDIVMSTAAFWNPQAASEYRSQKKHLIETNAEIAKVAEKLAALLAKRKELNNSSNFYSNSHYSIVDVIDSASQYNGHYKGFLKQPLESLSGQYDLKYWPSLSEVVSEIGIDAKSSEVYSSDSWTEAATSSQRSSVADFFRALFAAIEEHSEHINSVLPLSFKLTDNSLSIIANCALNLEPEEVIDGQIVKGIRQRLRKSA